MPTTQTTSERPHPRQTDIDRSPAYLLASLFAARRSGDYGLYLLCRDRLSDLGIHISFIEAGEAEAEVPVQTVTPPATRKAVRS
jgi:hypothetical protein